MATSASQPRSGRPYLLLIALLLITAFFFFARSVLIPLALAVMLSFILSPLVTRLERWRLGRVPSVLLVVTLVFALLGGLGWALSRQLSGLADQLPAYKTQIVRKIEGLRGAGEGGVVGRVRQALKDISEQLLEQEGNQPQAPAGQPGTSPDNPLYISTAPSPLSRLLEIAGPAGEGLVQFALVVVLVIFMLSQRENLRNRLVRLAGPGRLIVITRVFDEGGQRISRYLGSLLTINASFGLCISLGLLLLGVTTGERPLYAYALLWGLMCGALRFVPYLGTWVGAALLFGFTVAVLPNWWMPITIFAYFCAVGFLAANVAEPLLFGHSTGSSPVALLLATAFWAWLWGPIGLILATPMTVTLVVLGKYIPQLHFFSVLLGDEEVLRPSSVFYQRLLARDQDEASELAEEQATANGTEPTFQDLLLPALVMARRDREHEDLDEAHFQYVLDSTRQVLEDLPAPPAESPKADRTAPRVIVLGCPARDGADELALRMLERVLAALGYGMDVFSSTMLTAEVMTAASENCPTAVCIASLGPGGLAQARYLCKRVRTQCPEVKIVVARWGDLDDPERTQKRLEGAGADHVVTSFADARACLVPLLQVAAVQERQEEMAVH